MGDEAMAFGGALTFEIHAGDAPPGWDQALLADGGVVFHSEAWAAHKTGGGDGDPLFCQWREGDGGDVIGRGLGIRKPGRHSRAGRVVSKISFDSPPTAQGGGRDFVSPLADWARQSRGVVEVGLGSYDPIGQWQTAPLPRPVARYEYVLPPGAGEEALWSGMRQLARRKVKRAEKQGLESREATRPEELQTFAAVYRATEERLSRTKGYVPGAGAGERLAESLSRLIDRGAGRLYGAFVDGELEAGTVFATFGSRAYMIYSGATDSAREAGAPFLTMFTALRELRAAGFEHLSLGGAGGDAAEPGSPNHGLHQFKTRFGAEAEERTSGSLLVRPLRAKAIASARRLIRR